MESELRLILMVLGFIAIAALVVHGIYTIRKNKQIESEQYSTNTDAEADDGVISKPRVVTAKAKKVESSSDQASGDKKFSIKQSINNLKQEKVEKPKVRVEPELAGSQLQMELPDADDHFGDEIIDQISARETLESEIPSVSESAEVEQTAKSSEQNQSNPEEVLILNVVVAEGQQMSGAVLLPTLLTLGFKFGEFNIFHRHESPSGEGEVLFSLANMFNPGTFDIDNIEQFTTQGVSLFLSLPVAGDSQAAFNMMHNAAKKIAAEFNGQVLDGQRSVLTRQTVQHCTDRIREFERRQLLKA